MRTVLAKLAAVCLLALPAIAAHATAPPTAHYSSGALNFGNVNVASPSSTLTATFTFDSGGTGVTPFTLTGGATGLDFTDAGTGTCTTNGSAHTYVTNDTCTVIVQFTPAFPGLRLGAVQLRTSSADIATGYVFGTGIGPEAVLVPGTISTVAGGGASPSTCSGSTNAIGDGCLATNATINGPFDVAVDGFGNLYLLDSGNGVVRKVAAGTGIITTVAGTVNSAGDAGNNGPATSAQFNQPNGVATDGAGNFYIVEGGSSIVRKVDVVTGIITIVAGDLLLPSSPLVDNVAATSATLDEPIDLSVDGAGNLYIADFGNALIRKVTASTGIISTVAGGGATPGTCSGSTDAFGDGCVATSAVLGGPETVVVDAAGNLYIADSSNNLIRRVDGTTGIITIVAGNGTIAFNGDNIAATSAGLDNPGNADIDAAGNLYITDINHSRIRKVSSATGLITTVAGNGTAGFTSDGIAATASEIKATTVVTVDAAGNLYIADTANNRFRKVTATANPLTFATTTNGGSIDTTDGTKTVSFSNNGNATLNIAIPSPTGQNPSVGADFTYATGGGSCPQLSTSTPSPSPLLIGASCNLGVTFTPLATTGGSLNEQVKVTDNNLNVASSSQTVSLSATSVATVTTTTPVVTVGVASVTYGTASVSLSASIAYTPTPGASPTGAFTFQVDSGAIVTASCPAVTASPLLCSATYTTSALTGGGHTITGVLAADTNFNTASGTNTLTINKETPTFGTMTFSPAATETFGTSQIITISDTLTIPTGATSPTATHITYTLNGTGYSPTSCTVVTNVATCTATVPAATIAALGVNSYTVIAAFTNDTNYLAANGTSGTFTITKATPTFGTMSFSPAATEPFGTSQIITISDTLTFPTGSTAPTATNVTYTLNGTGYSPTSCTIVTNVATCTATVPAATIAALAVNGYTVTAAFTTDTNYLAATVTSGTFTISKATPTFGTMTFSPAATETFGTSQIITISDTLTFPTGSTAPTAANVTYALNGTGYSPTSCTVVTNVATCTATVPAATIAALAVNGYTVTAGFTTDTNYTAATGTSGTFTITKATPTFGTMTFSPAATETFGTSQIITISDTLTFPTGATAPTATHITYTLNGVGYSPTSCTVVSNVATCTATVPAATIAALAVNGYTVTAAFTTDTNYLAATGTSGTFTITKATPTFGTMSFSPAATEPFGASQIITISDSLTFPTGSTAPTATNVTYTLNGVGYSPTSCTVVTNVATCTATVPAATIAALAVNGYTVTAAFNTDTNYLAATGASGTFTISKATPTFGTMSFSPAATEPFGTSQIITISDTLTFNSGTAPTATNVTYTLNGTNYSPVSCTVVTNVATCTATVPAATIAALTVAGSPYAVTAAFTTDTNYNAATGTSGSFAITAIAPTTKTVSSVSIPAGSTTGLTVTATESGTGGVVTGGVVTFGLAGLATGSFSPTTCTLPVGGSCSVTYTPTGVLAASTYTNDITASFGAIGNYAAASATNTLTITTINPTTATVSAVSAPAGTTTGVTVTATESGSAGVVTGGVVTFGLANGATGSFSPTTCTLSSGGTCTTSYIPTGVLAASTYTNGITASFGAVTNYNAASAASNLVIGSVTPAVSTVSAVSSTFGTTTGITVTATESGSAGVVTGGVVTFGLAGSATGSFSPPTCTLTVAGTCTTTYTPTGLLTGGSYTNDITASFAVNNNYGSASGTSTLTINKASSTVALVQTVPTTTGVGTGVPTTFVATVSDASAGSTGTPTGSVNFLDGSTVLNPSPIALSGGVATITGVTFSTVTTHAITAVYLGDTNFAANTSSVLNEAVVTPAFSVVASPNNITIARGNSATATLTFTPVGNYQGALTLNCTGLPAFASCQFLPATVTFTGNNAVQTSQLTVFTLNAHDVTGSNQSLLWFPVAGMLAALIAIRRRKLARTLRPLLMMAIAALAMTALTGCGSSASFVTPAGINVVTVSASATGASGTSSGNTTQTATITITITQ